LFRILWRADEGEALTDAQLSAIVRSVVADKVATLNHTFIPILDRYIQGAHEAKNGNVMGVLLAVKREVLAVLTEELPPELQVLQGALMAPTP